MLVRVLLAGLLIYLACLAALVLGQRRLMYFPSGPIELPGAVGLPDTQRLSIETSDHERLVAWYRPADGHHPLFLFFHGNGGTLAIRAELFRRLSVDGSGFLAIDYRGYGGSTGTPSEKGLLIDGASAYAEARSLGYAPERIVVVGESLGTGVAIAVAADHPIAALVLDSAYDSTVDIAAAQYWMFPVRLTMMDTFMSKDRIGRVTAPKLFLHGEDDPVVPIASARRLFAAANPPKTFVPFPHQGHIALARAAAVDVMRRWLAGLDTQKPPVTPGGSAPSPRR